MPKSSIWHQTPKQFGKEPMMDERLDRVWLAQARACPSPNHQPRCEPVELVVIHCISLPPERFGTGKVEQLFLNRLDCNEHDYFARLNGLRVSSHFFIPRDGALVQFVALDRVAWHAGISCWQGRSGVNRFSLGIELEGSEKLPFTEAQYQQLRDLLGILFDYFPILSRERVVGHSDIAPGRKTDPGPYFDWSRVEGFIPAPSPVQHADCDDH